MDFLWYGHELKYIDLQFTCFCVYVCLFDWNISLSHESGRWLPLARSWLAAFQPTLHFPSSTYCALNIDESTPLICYLINQFTNSAAKPKLQTDHLFSDTVSIRLAVLSVKTLQTATEDFLSKVYWIQLPTWHYKLPNTFLRCRMHTRTLNRCDLSIGYCILKNRICFFSEIKNPQFTVHNNI